MKIFKELKEQYAWLWWWLLEQGIVVATILVHFFFLSIFIVVMVGLYFVMRWLKGH